MKSYLSKDLSYQEKFFFLIGGIAPRPIALVSTLSKDGISNLAPFSFFNAFGSNPPIVAFGPARRGRDNSLKDTYNNLMDTKECVIQVVTYDIVHQVNITSTEFPPEVDEFKESGLTPIDSMVVKPKRVKESPFHMECKLHQMVHVGSTNIAICEVLAFHVDPRVLKDGKIDPKIMDVVGRNGGQFYTRSHGSALFELPRPIDPPPPTSISPKRSVRKIPDE